MDINPQGFKFNGGAIQRRDLLSGSDGAPTACQIVDVKPDSVDGLQTTIRQSGFDASKWNGKTFRFVHESMAELYAQAGREKDFKGVSPRPALTMLPSDQGLMPLDTAVSMTLDYQGVTKRIVSGYRADIKAGRGDADFTTQAIKTSLDMAIDSGNRPVTASYYEKGNKFEGITPPKVTDGKAPVLPSANAGRPSTQGPASP